MQAFSGVARPPLAPSIRGVAVLADPLPFLFGASLLVAIALARRRRLVAALVPAVLLSANACTQILKPGLDRFVDVAGDPYPASWPSGHATAAMSVALCCVLVVGPGLRALAALLGAGYAVAVGYALVALGWHLPSDVLGGYLVAATFALAGAAALLALERGRQATGRPGSGVAAAAWPALAAAAVGLAGLAALALVARRADVGGVTLRHAEALLTAFAITTLALVLTSGLALALRRHA
jgi:membrane-associated phospholipid phosphatase